MDGMETEGALEMTGGTKTDKNTWMSLNEFVTFQRVYYMLNAHYIKSCYVMLCSTSWLGTPKHGAPA